MQKTLSPSTSGFILTNVETGEEVAVFTKTPEIVSGVFLISEDKQHLYTVLGYEIQFPEGSVIDSVFNYWVVYILNDRKILSHLDIHGLQFVLSDYLEIEDYGLLTSRGVTVLIDGYWRTFYYVGKFIEDYREPNLGNHIADPAKLIASGFSKSYLGVLLDAGVINISGDIYSVNDTEIRLKVNAQMNKDIKELSALSATYTTSQIASALNVDDSIAKVYVEYTKLGSWG